MQIIAASLHVLDIANPVVRESALPDRRLRPKPVREATLNKSNRAFNRDYLRGEDEMHVVWHDDEGMKLVMTRTPIVLQRLNEQLRIRGSLK